MWLVPTMGGEPRHFLRKAELSWSPRSKPTRLPHVRSGRPDLRRRPRRAESQADLRRSPGIHNHYPAWSPDGRFVYFVERDPSGRHGRLADSVRRRRPGTFDASSFGVGFPALLDDRTLIYTAPDEGWLVEALRDRRGAPCSRIARSFGVEEYLSIAASADGRRLVATVANPTTCSGRVPISDHVAKEGELTGFKSSRTRCGESPFGPDYLLLLSSRGGPNGLWKFKDGSETELWSGAHGVILGAPAISRDGAHIAFVVRGGGRGVRSCARVRRQHRATASRGPRRSRRAVLVSGREVDRGRRRIGDTAPLFKVPVQGGESGAPGRGNALRAGLVARRTPHPVHGRQPGRTDRDDPRRDTGPVRRSTLPEMPQVASRLTAIASLPTEKPRDHEGPPLESGLLALRSLVRGRAPAHRAADQSMIRSFDVSPDGKQIVFDRYRENSDIVLIDLPAH